MTPPPLPLAHVRTALDAGEWAVADRLLGRHHLALRDALSRTDLAREPIAPWRDLLAAMRALQAELRESREQVARQLAKLDGDRRGAHRWLRELK